MAKASKATKVYILADGSESRHSSVNVVRAEIRFVNGENVSVERDQLSDEIATCAMWHGWMQKVGDTYSGETDISVCASDAQDMADRLAIDGEWIAESKASGPTTNLLAEAIFAVKTEAGVLGEDETIATIIERYKGDAEKRKSAMANPQVAATYARIQAERATAKAEKLAEAAAATGESEAEVGIEVGTL